MNRTRLARDALNSLRAALENYPSGFISLILLAWAIPAIYSLVNTFFIGQMEMEAIAISEQYEYLAVTLEVLLEMFPLAVLALVAVKFTDTENASRVVRSALVMQLLITATFMAMVLLGTDWFVEAMNTPQEIRERSVAFLQVKALAMPFEALSVLFIISLKAMRRGRLAVIIALIGVLVNVVLDTIMISDLSFSLRLGLMGSAWDYVATKVLMFIISATAFYLTVRERPSIKFDRKTTAAIVRIGKYTGLESAVRNAGYILGMLVVLNTLGTAEYGGYGVAMTILWMIFLIPVLGLTEATNVAIGNEYGKGNLKGIRNVQTVSLLLMAGYMTMVAIVGLFAWEGLSSVFNSNEEVVRFSVLTFKFLAVPYIFFAISSALKTVFIGVGNTLYYFIPSTVVNLAMYVPLGIMVKMGLWEPTFEGVMMLSFFVFASDMVISALLVKRQYLMLSRSPK